MYAVIKTGGKQYRVRVGDKLRVEKLAIEEGADVTLDKVLLVGASDSDDVTVGTPYVDGAEISAKVTAQGRGEKIKIVKFKRRKNYHRTQGHRQPSTEIEIMAIRAPEGMGNVPDPLVSTPEAVSP